MKHLDQNCNQKSNNKITLRQFYMKQQIDPQLLARFKLIKRLGSGAYGDVFKVQDRADHKIKALKKNFDAFTNSTDAQRTYREIMFLFELKHPNVIVLQEIFKAKNGKDIYLLFECMDADLYDVTRKANVLTDEHRKFILFQVAKSLFYLHSAGLIHRDLKPSNVLINEQCDAKICDFGLVRSVDENNEQQEIMTDYVATRWYRAPQILLGSQHYSLPVDIWSFGCLIAEIFTGKPLFPGRSTLNQIERVLMWTGVPSVYGLQTLKTNFGEKLLDLISKLKPINKKQAFGFLEPSCYDLLIKTLEFRPDQRITIEQVMRHPYFKQYYRPSQLMSSKKIVIPVKDSMKLNLREYRSLIYEYISKHNTKNKDYSISKSRKKTLESSSFQRQVGSKNERAKSFETGKHTEQVKMIKKTDMVRKKNTFFEISQSVLKNTSLESKYLKPKNQLLRKHLPYKNLKSTVVCSKRLISEPTLHKRS